MSLKMPEQFGIKAKLDYELGLGTSGKLCVYDLVAEITQRRGMENFFNKIGMSEKGVLDESCLVDDIRT